MSKMERLLRKKFSEKKEAFDKGVEDNVSTEELRGLKDEMVEAREKLDMFIETRAIDLPDDPEPLPDPEPAAAKSVREMTNDEVEARYKKTFIKAIRRKKLTTEDAEVFEKVKEIRKFSGIDAEAGGVLVPIDALNTINELKREFVDLSQFVTIESVSTRSGSRVIEKEEDMTPFANITEWDEIDEIENPNFGKIEYAIKDYAGILPIPNGLLQDNDANLLTYVYRWIAKKSVLTRNLKIIEIWKALKTKSDIKNLDSLKDVFNVTLDPAISVAANVITNQTGFNWLDKIKDEKGNYILQPDPTDKTKRLLFGIHSVAVVSNKHFKNDGTKAPIVIGDTKSATTLFDRNVYEILTTNVGGKSFTRNTTDMRVIDRFDIKEFDGMAAIYGSIDTGVIPEV